MYASQTVTTRLVPPMQRPDFVVRDSFRDGLVVDLTPRKPEEIPPLLLAEPTADSVRDLAILLNYSTLVDVSDGGGHGVYFGKKQRFEVVEYLAVARDPRPEFADEHTVSLLVQVPANFDFDNPGILAVPSPGSRGIYGGVAVGEWGLEKGFAVAYTDKGTGCGIHELDNGTMFGPDGVPLWGIFAARGDGRFPSHRLAYKHAHSQALCEEAWGQYVLMAAEYAIYVLHREAKRRSKTLAKRPLVIASSYSNGGGACLRAAEQDKDGLIDGVVAIEPNISPPKDDNLVIQQQGKSPVTNHSRLLFDYTTLVNIYQGCIPPANAPDVSQNRRARLVELGLLTGATAHKQIDDAQKRMRDYGLLPEQEHVQQVYWDFSVPPAISVTYTYAYGRLPVNDKRVGYSFAYVDEFGRPTSEPAAKASLPYAFALSNGLVPDGLLGVKLINDRSPGGDVDNSRSLSATGLADANLDGALRLRAFFTGHSAQLLTEEERQVHQTVQESLRKIRATGRPGGIPVIIIHGRADAIIAPNHTSRPYYALAEGHGADIRYYEITNATHIDALLSQSGLTQGYVPLHRYALQGLELMLGNLTGKSALPPSQVVHTTPRQGQAITNLNLDQLLPLINQQPAQGIQITHKGNELFIPN